MLVGGCLEPGQVARRAQPLDLPQLGLVAPARRAGQHEGRGAAPGARAVGLVGAEEGRQVLARLDRADEEEEGAELAADQPRHVGRQLAAGARRAGQALQAVERAEALVGRLVHDGDLLGRRAGQLDQVAPRTLGDRDHRVGAREGGGELAVVAPRRGVEQVRVAQEGHVMHGDDRARAGAQPRRDEVGAVQEVEPVGRQLDAERRPLQPVVRGRAERAVGDLLRGVHQRPAAARHEDGVVVDAVELDQRAQEEAGVAGDAGLAVGGQAGIQTDPHGRPTSLPLAP